jgi:hypothetical protein
MKEREGLQARSKRVCYRCGKSGKFIAKCPYTSDSDRDDDKKGKKMDKKRYYKRWRGAHGTGIRLRRELHQLLLR